MKIGFTGTRQGMTTDQWAKVVDIIALHAEELNEWHDGDCQGADTQAGNSVRSMRKMGTAFFMHGHPSHGQGTEKWRAHSEYDFIWREKPPLVRNRDIVDSVDLMIAGPREFDEVVKGSGTWATIRYAKRKGVRLFIVYPDASVEEVCP